MHLCWLLHLISRDLLFFWMTYGRLLFCVAFLRTGLVVDAGFFLAAFSACSACEIAVISRNASGEVLAVFIGT